MKKRLLIGLSIILGLTFVFIVLYQNKNTETDKISNDAIVKIHEENLSNSPFKETLKLTKAERKAAGLPPNKYNEEEYELTMNPILGRPTFENLEGIRSFIQQSARSRVPGDGISNDWESRGPDNVAGRTRGMMFDPNDATNETVFAGGVSGGLWKNTNISNPNSVWTRVDLPDNLNVSIIVSDPNNTNVFYAGTGESYVNGDVSGDGVWQSTDAGDTWFRIFGGATGPSVFESGSNITVNSPSNIAGDYVSVPTTSFGATITATITADFVLANDTTSANPTEGCGTFGADATGRIAIIRRGSCPFVDKVRNAQDAGAIGAIVLNNVDGTPIPLGGTDATITIPAVMISKADGDIIEAALLSGTVNGSLNPATGNFTGLLVPGIQHINDIKIKDNAGVSEVYVAAGDAIYGSSNETTFLGGTELGVFKSVDEGATWEKVNIPQTVNGNDHEPNDIEVGADGKIWVSTNISSIFGDGGGQIFSSTDGFNFTLTHTVNNADRTQIAVSSQNADVIYVLAEIPGGVIIQETSDGFATTINTALPDDADNGIPPEDFTRGQAFYDLLIDVDPTNDQIIYAGGIDLFKSVNGAISWPQISKWSNNNNLAALNVPLVHADQHAMVFAPGNPNRVLFGTDGGVYFSDDGGNTISSRENGFVTAQFYTIGVAPTEAFAGDSDYFVGGLQDNGTQLFEAAVPGLNSSTTAFGGDGAHSFFDQDGTDQYFITNFVFNRAINLFDLSTGDSKNINNEGTNNGSFINPQALDSNLDILYSNYSAGANSIIRRYSNIKPGTGAVSRVNLTDPVLTSRPTAMEVSPFTSFGTTLFVGTILGDIIKVENANIAPSWTNIETDNVIVGSISDIQLGASENEIFVTVHNYGVQNIWYTNDGGNTWVGKEGDLPDLPVKAILQNPLNPEEVIIGTELGIWFTSNFSSNSPSWLPAQNGMSNVRVTDIDLRDDNAIFVSTYGRGVFSGQFSVNPDGDIDGDGVVNSMDNCPNTENADQADSDGNGIGDVCQDTDDDGIIDIDDNCPDTANPNQEDADGDGIGDICQDTDGDGITDSIDNCPNTANPGQADGNGSGVGDICDMSFENPSNITLEITSERCEGQSNGEAIVRVIETFVNYTVTISGTNINTTQTINGNENSTVFSDLAVGPYTICVSVNARNYEQCFEINIDEAPILGAVFGVADNDEGDTDEEETTSVNISSGTAPYTIVFNNEVVMVTSEASFSVNTSGGGLLEVSSAVACEGKISRVIEDLSPLKLTYGPNPVINNLRINIPNAPEDGVGVQIYDVHGKLVSNKQFNVQNGTYINVPFQNLTQGIYFVRLDIEKTEMIKIIKN